MSDRKLFGIFSGAQLTAMVITTVIAPSAVYATVSYSNVAIVNATTGVPVNVDTSGRVPVIDVYASYRNSPSNQIDFVVINTGAGRSGNGICEINQWTIPSGKAFIITAVSGFEVQDDPTYQFTGFYVYSGVGCSGHLLTAHFSTGNTIQAYNPVTAEYGVGIPVPAGSVISVQSVNNHGRTFIHGYFVPASAVSASQYIGG